MGHGSSYKRMSEESRLSSPYTWKVLRLKSGKRELSSHMAGAAAFHFHGGPASFPGSTVFRGRSKLVCRRSSCFDRYTNASLYARRRSNNQPTMSIFGKDKHHHSSDDDEDENMVEPWRGALEALFFEALLSYYEGTPMFEESEFQTLRDELEYLGSGAVRLASMEKLWVVASQQRDFDRKIRKEFGMSEAELDTMKMKLKAVLGRRRRGGTVLVKDLPPSRMDGRRRLEEWRGDGNAKGVGNGEEQKKPRSKFAADADKVEADHAVNERLKYLLFGDAVEEKFKLALLYLPAAMMAIVAASVLTMLFALLDGEMIVTITSTGRIRLGILSYCVVMGTIWFTNTATPMILSYLDLGKPVLLKAKCPNCQGPVSCLFTSCIGRVRDERKCKTCGAVVGFNSRWSKVYLVAPPHHDKYLTPD